jgi:dipeptidyl-peptidase-4
MMNLKFLQTGSQPIYRHSFLGTFDVKDLKSGKTIALNDGKPVQEPRFSPDATKSSFHCRQ